MRELPFKDSKIKVGHYIALDKEFRARLALLEVLGLSYLDALEKQNINIDINGQLRKILEEDDE
jgi:hypothetical protein